jgi:division protein CdvB (Snf7/Vps24/ESCRT-III family)
MGVPLSVNANARDFIFTFNDACNCCCWGGGKKQPRDDDQVVLKNNGTYEKFNPKKNKDAIDANRITIARLEGKIEALSNQLNVDKREIKNRVSMHAGVNLDDKPKVSMRTLEKINEVFLDVLDEKKKTAAS